MVEVSNNFIQECEANVGTYKFGKIKVNYIDDNSLNYEQGAYSSTNGTKIDATQSVRYNKLVECEPNFKYKIELGNSAIKMKIITYTEAQAFIAAHDNLVDGNELTTEATARYISVTIYSNDTLEGTAITLNNTIKNGEIAGVELKGNTIQNGTPTPDAPVEVKTVTGEQVVRVCGKNLFDASIQAGTYGTDIVYTIGTDGLITQSKSDNSAWNKTQNRNFYLEAGTYTISCIGKGTEKRMQVRNLTDNVDLLQTQSETYTFTLNARKLVAFKTWGNSSYPASYYVQIERGSTVTTYEPYQGKDYEINLGKNLANPSNFRFYSQANASCSYDYETNTLTMTTLKEATSNAIFFFSKINDNFLENGKTYTISSVNVSGVVRSLKLQLRNKDGSNANKSMATSVTYDNTYSLYIVENPFASSGSTTVPKGSMAVVKDIQVKEGTSADNFSPYFEPIELNKIGNYQDFIRKGTGKNLLQNNSTTQTINGVTFTKNDDGSILVNGTATRNTWYVLNSSITLEAGTYTISSGNTNNNIRLVCDALGGFIINGLVKKTINETKTSDVSINAPSGSTANNLLFKPMIVEGSTATTYEPYGYKDKWYIEKNVDMYNSWTEVNLKTDYTNTSRFQFILPSATDSTKRSLALCNYFENAINNNDTEHLFIGTATPNIYNGLNVFISKARATTSTEAINWLKSNNVKVYYILAMPTYILIENEELLNQLEAVSHAETQEGITNIMTTGDLPATLKVTPDLTESIRGKQTTPIVGYNITGDDDLINFKITSKADSNGNILGATSQSQVDIEIFNENNTHNLENKQVYISTGLAETEGNYCKWQPFTITQTKDTQTKNHTTYTGYDDMMRGNEAYIDNIDYGEDGITLYDFTCNLAKEMGMALGNTTMTNGDFIVKGNNFTNNETKLVVLKNVAQMVGGFAMIDRDNLLRIVELSPEDAMTPIELTTNLYTEDFQNSAKFGEINEIAIGETNLETNAIVRSDEEAIAKDGVKKIEILDNLFLGMLEDKETAIDPLWDAFEGFNYYPFKTQYNGYPYIDLGDKLNITDINNNTYNSFIFNYVFEYNGGYKGNVGAEALSVTAAKYKTNNTLGKQFRKVGIEIDRVEGKITQEVNAMSQDLTTAYSGAIETSEENIMGQVKTIQTTLYGPTEHPEEGLEKIVATHSSQIDATSQFVNIDIKNKLDTTYNMADAVTNNTKEIVESFNFNENGMLITNKGTETSDMALLVSNAAIIFKYRGNNVLVINGEKIEFSAVSFQKLDLGNYVWQAEQDDSLSLIYEGGNT